MHLFIGFLLILLSTLFDAKAMDIDISSNILNNTDKKGRFFYGLSAGINFFAPYRDYGDESLKTAGNVSSAFVGYAIKDWIMTIGYEHTVSPIEYNGTFDSLSASNNIKQHPEFFVEVNYYLSRKYFWQPYLIYGMSMGWENNNGSFIDEGVGNHYDFGAGVNFQINHKWGINVNAILSVIKHQTLPVEMYMNFGLDVNQQVYDNLLIVYAITYRTPRMNDHNHSALRTMPIEIDFHGHSALLFEIGIIFS